MEEHHDSKAGPSQPQPRWMQRTSRWQRQAVKAIALVVVVTLGYIAFVRLSNDGFEANWLWRTTSQAGYGNKHGSSKGSQYLVGVGKADITGLGISPFPDLIEY